MKIADSYEVFFSSIGKAEQAFSYASCQAQPAVLKDIRKRKACQKPIEWRVRDRTVHLGPMCWVLAQEQICLWKAFQSCPFRSSDLALAATRWPSSAQLCKERKDKDGNFLGYGEQ